MALAAVAALLLLAQTELELMEGMGAQELHLPLVGLQ
jgi:hypothetical protein